MNDIGQKKILSIGVNATEHKKAPVSQRDLALTASKDAFRKTLKQDMHYKAESKQKEKEADLVHPFDRKGGPTKLLEKHKQNVERYSGYAIGSQDSTHQEQQRRKEYQQKYLEQLRRDQETSRKIQQSPPAKAVIRRRPPSPDITDEFAIGIESTAGGEAAKEKQKMYFQLNQEDISRRQMLRQQKNTEIDIDGRFTIGDDVRQKEKKDKANREYLEALNRDLGDRKAKVREKKDIEYVNVTGWSGLNIGGCSTGDTNSSANLRTQVEKREKYKSLLDTQMSDAAERKREEKLKEEAEMANMPSPPYLEKDRE